MLSATPGGALVEVTEAEEKGDEDHAEPVGERGARSDVGGAGEKIAAVGDFFAEGGEGPDDGEQDEGVLPIVGRGFSEGRDFLRSWPKVRREWADDEFAAELQNENRGDGEGDGSGP